jgi:hypothetical protein
MITLLSVTEYTVVETQKKATIKTRVLLYIHMQITKDRQAL